KGQQKNPADEFAFKRETTVGTVKRELVEKAEIPECGAKERGTERDADNQSCLAGEISGQLGRGGDPTPNGGASQATAKSDRTRKRREQRKRALLRKKEAAVELAVRESDGEIEATSENIPRPSSPAIETTTPEVGCDRATLPGGVGVEGAVRADAQETPSPLASKAVGAKSKRGKGQQKNPTASKFKSEKIASAKFTLPSSFQLSRLLSSRSEPVETTAKFNHVNESKSIHKHISFEQLPPSTPVEPWIVRERLRIKAAKRRRMERQPVNDTWSVVCRNILLCFVLAAVVMLAYCFF
ncbi:unnamed protein product, partial [Hymenolepis diminuta]